jgi:hypothetical protein
METPLVNVGVLTEKIVECIFNEEYIHKESGDILTGRQQAQFVNGRIVFNKKRYRELFFEPLSPTASFDLKAVTIEEDFQRQHKEDQRFYGALNLVAVEDDILVINQVDAEEYLTSVVSSEMNGTASLELLKAHAVISRSRLFAQMAKICEDHTLFDVCADDHCRRYQGIIHASPLVAEAIRETRGEILTRDGVVCDACFSTCGGATESLKTYRQILAHDYPETDIETFY